VPANAVDQAKTRNSNSNTARDETGHHEARIPEQHV
jgi:hypothetical protein